MDGFFIPLSIRDAVNAAVETLVGRFGDQFRDFSGAVLQYALVPLESALRALPPPLLLAVAGLIAWHATKSAARSAALTALLYLIGCFGLWDALMQTLAVMLVATALAVATGLPTGVAMSQSDRLRRLLLPLLDVMQTLPSFVYLIPVMMLFGLGKVPAIFATVVYAVPPLIRLTDLGIREVDRELTEAARAFGTTRWQLLVGVQLPLARPAIMAGVNQTTMLALAMVVLASMIGARGLGEDVLVGIQTLDVGRGMQAGLAIVILAVVIDRVTQAYGRPRRPAAQTGTGSS